MTQEQQREAIRLLTIVSKASAGHRDYGSWAATYIGWQEGDADPKDIDNLRRDTQALLERLGGDNDATR